MGKNNKENKVKKEKVLVGIYEDEYDKVKENLKLEQITSKDVRIALGLRATHRKAYTGELVSKIRGMTEEAKEKLLKELEEKEK